MDGLGKCYILYGVVFWDFGDCVKKKSGRV